jgi:stearoyl-CoA desaturase (delta-9 desaturase)
MPDVPLFSVTWWEIALYVVALGLLSSLAVSLYLHRSMTHGGVTFHPLVAGAMRFVVWLMTGMQTREWVATHRKHHAFSDREGDPHSPLKEGLMAIVLGNVVYYRRASKDFAMLEKYGKGTPDDWLERNVFSLNLAGILLMLVVDLVLFGGLKGTVAWVAGIGWMPFWGGIINGVGHAVGYRNFNVKDVSKNILPILVLAGGEELHNNHHADPRSAKFSARWYEFDLGWLVIRLLSAVGLARVDYARKMSVQEFNAKHYRVATYAPNSQLFGPNAGDVFDELEASALDESTTVGDSTETPDVVPAEASLRVARSELASVSTAKGV